VAEVVQVMLQLDDDLLAVCEQIAMQLLQYFVYL